MLKIWMKERIKDWSTTLLQLLLLIVSLVTLVNVAIVYWYVDILPVALFSAVWYMIRSFIEQSPYLIINSIVICILLFLSVFSIHRKKILIPFMTLLYLFYDLYQLIIMFFNGLDNGLWDLFVVQMIISVVLIVLMIRYCYIVFRKRHPRKKTYY